MVGQRVCDQRFTSKGLLPFMCTNQSLPNITFHASCPGLCHILKCTTCCVCSWCDAIWATRCIVHVRALKKRPPTQQWESSNSAPQTLSVEIGSQKRWRIYFTYLPQIILCYYLFPGSAVEKAFVFRFFLCGFCTGFLFSPYQSLRFLVCVFFSSCFNYSLK